MQGEYFVFNDLRRKGIPYSRNQLDKYIKDGLFPPGRRFSKKGRRHWTDEDIQVGKQNMVDASSTDQET
jgi:hypothetical protein